MERTPIANDSILRWPEVYARIGLSRSHIHALIARGKFPAPLKLGARASGWLESEINAWLNERITESRPNASDTAIRGGERYEQ